MVFCNNLLEITESNSIERHNPYFNRWFSAIWKSEYQEKKITYVTILILIDGFLQ